MTAGSRPQAPRRLAYTLVEMLAVAVLLGLVATVVGPAFLRQANYRDVPAEVLASVQRGWSEARSAAVQAPVTVDLDATGLRWPHQGAWTDLRLEPDLVLHWVDPISRHPLRSLTIDAAGRSADGLLEVDLAGQTCRFRLLGLTGAWSEETPSRFPGDRSP